MVHLKYQQVRMAHCVAVAFPVLRLFNGRT